MSNTNICKVQNVGSYVWLRCVCWTRYLLSLSDLQVMVGRVRDNWKVSYHKGTSLLHVVDKFSISLQFDRYPSCWGNFKSVMSHESLLYFFSHYFSLYIQVFTTWKTKPDKITSVLFLCSVFVMSHCTLICNRSCCFIHINDGWVWCWVSCRCSHSTDRLSVNYRFLSCTNCVELLVNDTVSTYKQIGLTALPSIHLHYCVSACTRCYCCRRLLYTTDPRCPKAKLSGNVPSLVLHISEKKVCQWCCFFKPVVHGWFFSCNFIVSSYRVTKVARVWSQNFLTRENHATSNMFDLLR